MVKDCLDEDLEKKNEGEGGRTKSPFFSESLHYIEKSNIWRALL